MTRVVESVAPEFKNILVWEKVVTKELAGALRYSEFSKSLGRPAPVPSIVIEGKLVFESTPGVKELKDYINQLIKNLQ